MKVRPINKQYLYNLISTAKGDLMADLYIKNGTVINVYTGELVKANVAVKGRHIAYVGEAEHMVGKSTEVLDAAGFYLCPGYIDPHVHPFQTYNPVTLAEKIMTTGTTTIICDNLFFFNHMDASKLTELWQELAELPVKILWWVRLDPQTFSDERSEEFFPAKIEFLLDQAVARQAGELTDWPSLVAGRDQMLENILTAGRLGKRVEGHLPGASLQTLNVLAAGGVTDCHESIKGEEALQRLRLGMYATLRHSSLRPDMRQILPYLIEAKVDLRRTMITTDGTTPPIMRNGFIDYILRIAMECGLAPMEAYRMATLNPATYYGLDGELGGIAPGRLADILFLEAMDNPTPVKVITEGALTAENGSPLVEFIQPNWHAYNINPIISCRLQESDIIPPAYDGLFPIMHFISPAITKIREAKLPARDGKIDISGEPGLIYCTLVDHLGEWVCNGIVGGFAEDLEGMACSNTYSGDFLAMGRNPEEILRATRRMYELGGGVVVAEAGQIIYELPLPLGGMMSDRSLDELIPKSEELYELLAKKGHIHYDLLYMIHFFSATHLPAIRLSPRGLFSVKDKRVLIPTRKIGS